MAEQTTRRSGGARKVRKRPMREEKRARNKARNDRGEKNPRGARRTRLTPVELALMGKGQVRSWTPEWTRGKPRGVRRRFVEESQ